MVGRSPSDERERVRARSGGSRILKRRLFRSDVDREDSISFVEFESDRECGERPCRHRRRVSVGPWSNLFLFLSFWYLRFLDVVLEYGFGGNVGGDYVRSLRKVVKERD